MSLVTLVLTSCPPLLHHHTAPSCAAAGSLTRPCARAPGSPTPHTAAHSSPSGSTCLGGVGGKGGGGQEGRGCCRGAVKSIPLNPSRVAYQPHNHTTTQKQLVKAQLSSAPECCSSSSNEYMPNELRKPTHRADTCVLCCRRTFCLIHCFDLAQMSTSWRQTCYCNCKLITYMYMT